MTPVGLRSLILAIIISMGLSACAPKVQSYDPFMDRDLNCDQLALEISKTRSLKAEAQSNKGMSGQNIAWALVFWPAIFANESNNSDAIRIADERLFHLYGYYDAKQCTTPVTSP
jgi:hypothetical protein